MLARASLQPMARRRQEQTHVRFFTRLLLEGRQVLLAGLHLGCEVPQVFQVSHQVLSALLRRLLCTHSTNLSLALQRGHNG